MEKYELVDVITGRRYELMGLSQAQKYCFSYKVSEGFNQDVHISHINKDCFIVYDKRYQLTEGDVDYLYKDLGGAL